MDAGELTQKLALEPNRPDAANYGAVVVTMRLQWFASYQKIAQFLTTWGITGSRLYSLVHDAYKDDWQSFGEAVELLASSDWESKYLPNHTPHRDQIIRRLMPLEVQRGEDHDI